MYKKGDLQLTDPPCVDIDEWNTCPNSGHPGHCHRIGMYTSEEAPPPCAYLPHSCDEWVIGGPEQIKAMIEDLTELLALSEQKEQDLFAPAKRFNENIRRDFNRVELHHPNAQQEGK